MPFIETPRFPENIAVGSKFGPVYNTAIARNIGGHEVANQNWSMPLHQGDVAHGVKSQANLDDLLAFFHGVAGMQNGFRFKNYADFATTGSQGTLTTLSATTWQMHKTYTFGALTMQRKIQKPIAGAVIAGGGTYTYSTVTGIITKSAGADPTSWTGEFDFPVRFNTDEMMPQWLSFGIFDMRFPIIEVRV